MQEPRQGPRPPGGKIEPWWNENDEPEFLVLPEAGTEARDAQGPSPLEGVADRLAALERLAGGTASEMGAIRTEVEGVREAVREATATLASLLSSTGAQVRSSVEDASNAMADEHASTMERYEKEFTEAVRPLADGLTRMEHLASVIEAMGKRRGFRDLVRSEQALRDEQASLVRTLTDAGADLVARTSTMSERMDRLEERLEAATREIETVRQVPGLTVDRVAAEVARLRGELADELQARFVDQAEATVSRLRAELDAGLPIGEALGRLREVVGTQSDLSHVQRSIDGVVASLRTEVRALQDRISRWGPPRTAPRLAREVHELGERVDALEAHLRADLPERVAAALEARILAAIPARRRRRRPGPA